MSYEIMPCSISSTQWEGEPLYKTVFEIEGATFCFLHDWLSRWNIFFVEGYFENQLCSGRMQFFDLLVCFHVMFEDVL